MINTLMKSIFGSGQKILSSITEHVNILGKYDEKTILTYDQNLLIGFKIVGIDYIGMSAEKEEELHSQRFDFFTRLKNNFEVGIFLKKYKDTNRQQANTKIDNIFAKEVVTKWEENIEFVKTSYFLFISTKKDSIIDRVDKNIKQKDTDDTFDSFGFKKERLEDFSNDFKNIFKDYQVEELNANEILSFYATLLNGEDTEVNCDDHFFDDYFVKADIRFEKNYFIRSLPQKDVFSSILSITTYNNDFVSRANIIDFLKSKSNIYICIGLEPLSKKESGVKLQNAMAKTKDINIIDELENLKEKYETDKVNFFNIAIHVLIEENSLLRLNSAIEEIVAISKRNNLIMKRETISQDVNFISLFPSRFLYNTRKRTQTSAVVTNYISFESDPMGSDFNSWGNSAVAVFKNKIGKPYLFNFHLPIQKGESRNSLKVGHTLIIGSTGVGKTSLASFLMTNLLKYENLNIFALDKFFGMKIFTNFVGGEYNDVGSNFSLNPFSLSNTTENRNFLINWLSLLARIENSLDFQDEAGIISSAINRIYEHSNDNEKSFASFLASIEYHPVLDIRFSKYKESIFDNETDTLDFKNRLSILNMDSILKDQEMTSFIAYYIFQKVISTSVENGKGFFIFIDELREYLGNEAMANEILRLILEARKLNGAICMGVQNLNFFEEKVGSNIANTFLDNIAHFIIYPNASSESIDYLKNKLDLTSEEEEFLRKTPATERKVLVKQGAKNSIGIQSSSIIDINLLPLQEYLKIFSSSITDVTKMEKLKNNFGDEWRREFLKD